MLCTVLKIERSNGKCDMLFVGKFSCVLGMSDCLVNQL